MGESIEQIKSAISDLKKGKFILIYDDDNRERETDLVISSEFVTPESIKIMRKDGGGLIFIMTSHEIAKKLQLPYLSDLYSHIEYKYPVLKEIIANDIPYDNKSSFSLYINHRETYTGITDKDRSLTMKSFAELIKKISKINSLKAIQSFGKEFRSPGHIPICVASKNILKERFGHTELVIAMMTMAGLTPVGSGCEMMGNNGNALSKEDAMKYAIENNLIFIEGKDVKKAWEKWLK